MLAAEHEIPRTKVSLGDPVALGDEGAHVEHGHEPKTRCSRPRAYLHGGRGRGDGEWHGIGTSVRPQPADRPVDHYMVALTPVFPRTKPIACRAGGSSICFASTHVSFDNKTSPLKGVELSPRPEAWSYTARTDLGTYLGT